VRSIRSLEPWKPRRGLLKRLLRAVTGSGRQAALVRPLGVSVAGRVVYITDPGAGCVHALDGEDSSYVRIPRKGTLVSPVDAAADADGNVFVTDSKRATVTSFAPDGRRRYSLPGTFVRPTGIAFDAGRNLLYITDTGAHSIITCAPDGSSRRDFGTRGGGQGEFNFPTSIRLAADSALYVVDAMNFRVQRLDRSGTFHAMFGRLGDGSGNFSRPKGIALDPDGHVYVVDALFDAVQIFDRDGTFLLAFGEPGRGAGQFWLPSGIAIDPDGTIYVADAYNARVQVFEYLGDSKSREP